MSKQNRSKIDIGSNKESLLALLLTKSHTAMQDSLPVINLEILLFSPVYKLKQESKTSI